MIYVQGLNPIGVEVSLGRHKALPSSHHLKILKEKTIIRDINPIHSSIHHPSKLAEDSYEISRLIFFEK